MPEPTTTLTERSRSLMSAILFALAVMAVSPTAEVIADRWPMRWGEAAWRFDIVLMLLSNGPQLVVLLGIITTIGVLLGNRRVVRGAAIAFAIVFAAHVVLVPTFALDFLQVRHTVPVSRAAVVKMASLKAIGFGLLIIVMSGWAALRGWQASANEGAGPRRQKGEGLVVGQAGPATPPA
jgi:hypothetical protein